MSIPTQGMLKYPTQESALVYTPENSIPFAFAVVGITQHIENYCVSAAVESSHLRIDHILDGEGEYWVDGQWITARAGDTFLLTPHSRYITRGSVHKLWLSFEAEYSTAFLRAYHVSSGVYRTPQLRQYFDAITQLTQENPGAAYVHFGLAEHVQRIIHRIAFSMRNLDADSAVSMRNLLNAMIYQKASLTDVAHTMHMSKTHVIRVFKKRFGITPYQYLLEQKIETAKILLKETNISVKDISERLCITDEHYFSELFKKYTALSPSEYRRENRMESHPVAK